MFSLLFAGLAYAGEMVQTPSPGIFGEVGGNDVSVNAVGEGETMLYDDSGDMVIPQFLGDLPEPTFWSTEDDFILQ